ncbi:MAG: hypothetical protein COA60_006760 [Robiginitomaculum sp.]|nr:hypothetical protein [Robiginitomaculum sp.]
MSTEKMQEDINWIKQMAEEGRDAPLSGSSIGVWWAILTSLMMLLHWATLSGYMPFAIQYIGLGWLSYAVLGFIGTIVLGKKIQRKGGARSINDRVLSATWAMFGAGISTFSIGVVIAVFVTEIPYWLFNVIMPVSFIGYGIANGITAVLSKNKISTLSAIASFVLALIMMTMLNNVNLYLIAAIGVLVVILPPSLLSEKTRK